jgi:hypothetical protein
MYPNQYTGVSYKATSITWRNQQTISILLVLHLLFRADSQAKTTPPSSKGANHFFEAERQKEGQEHEHQTGYKAIVNRNHSNCTTAPSRKSGANQF